MAQNGLPTIFLVRDVAHAFRMHATGVRRLLQSGRLQGYRLGGRGSRWRIPASAVEAFLTGSYVGLQWLARRQAE